MGVERLFKSFLAPNPKAFEGQRRNGRVNSRGV